MSRTTAYQRGYTKRWSRARTMYLREHPLCAMCTEQGRVTAAAVVDHKIPHKGNLDLMWDRDNWQSLCKPHHDSAKQSEDIRGFSNAVGSDGWPTDPKHPANSNFFRK